MAGEDIDLDGTEVPAGEPLSVNTVPSHPTSSHHLGLGTHRCFALALLETCKGSTALQALTLPLGLSDALGAEGTMLERGATTFLWGVKP